jgi:hypothetical protein
LPGRVDEAGAALAAQPAEDEVYAPQEVRKRLTS